MMSWCHALALQEMLTAPQAPVWFMVIYYFSPVCNQIKIQWKMTLNYFCPWKTRASPAGFQHNQAGVESRTLFASEEFSFTRNPGFVRLPYVYAVWGCGCTLTVRSRCHKAQRKSLGAASGVNPCVCSHAVTVSDSTLLQFQLKHEPTVCADPDPELNQKKKIPSVPSG